MWNTADILLDVGDQVCCIKQIVAYARKRHAEVDTKQQGMVRFVTDYGVTFAPKPSTSACKYPTLFL